MSKLSKSAKRLMQRTFWLLNTLDTPSSPHWLSEFSCAYAATQTAAREMSDVLDSREKLEEKKPSLISAADMLARSADMYRHNFPFPETELRESLWKALDVYLALRKEKGQ